MIPLLTFFGLIILSLKCAFKFFWFRRMLEILGENDFDLITQIFVRLILLIEYYVTSVSHCAWISPPFVQFPWLKHSTNSSFPCANTSRQSWWGKQTDLHKDGENILIFMCFMLNTKRLRMRGGLVSGTCWGRCWEMPCGFVHRFHSPFWEKKALETPVNFSLSNQ